MKNVLLVASILMLVCAGFAFSGEFMIFDENAELLADLTGSGEIDGSEAYAGDISMKMEASGRSELYNGAVPAFGDGLKIVENPGEGEYRYMTFAMKGTATTMALDFPVDLKWGVSRYYVGPEPPFAEPIVQSDSAVPSDWKVYTMDVFSDFGELNITGWNFFVLDGIGWFDFIYVHSEPQFGLTAISADGNIVTTWGKIKADH